MAYKTPTWQRKEGQSESGGLSEAGRRSLRAAGHDIKRPQPEGGPRKDSFCARMEGAKKKLTSPETARDPNSRINKALRKWKCADGGDVTVDNALRTARNMGGALPPSLPNISPTPMNPPQDPGPQQPYYQSLAQTRDIIQQYGAPAPAAPTSSAVRQPMPYADGGPVWNKPRPKNLGKSEPLSPSQKASAKAMAKSAGRPYPNMVDNIRAARHGYATDGAVEGDMQFSPADLPMMARQPDVEIENALRMAKSAEPVRYDTGPQPGEAVMRSYDPTIKERIYQGVAGTEQRPSPERAQFARGISQMAELAPVLGNVMAGQEAQRRGDTKGMLMAALPVPGAATEARMAQSAVKEAGSLTNWLSSKYPNVDFSISEPKSGHIVVNKIIVPEDMRGKGIGTQFMNDIASYSDALGKSVALSPSSDFGGVKGKLENWYKSLGFFPNKGRSRDLTVSESFVRKPQEIADIYQGSHQAPGPENGAPLWRMHQIYPDDLYSPHGFRYYADFGNPYDMEGYSRAISAVNQPSKSVTIYRAVPNDPSIKGINQGDWVTMTKDYAKEHGESQLGGNYKILKKNVKARDLFTHGDSIHEFGYNPQPYVSDVDMVAKMSPSEAKKKLSQLSEKARSSLRKALELRSSEEQ